jgi:endoglucanase
MNFALFKELSEAAGIPSREHNLRRIVRREMKGRVDSLETDALGNVIGFRKGRGKGTRRKVMIAAHMDEIGFLVKHIDDRGFLRLQPLGGFDPRQLFAQRVFVHGASGEAVRGVLVYNTKPTHLLDDHERAAAPKLDNFYVDLGLPGDEVKKLARVGDMVTLDRTLERCGRCVIGKAIDNRAGVLVLLETLQRLKKHDVDVYAVATTQEEIGLRGAGVAAYGINPDIGVALDTTLATDYPGMPEPDICTRLGKGVGIKIMDASLVCHPRLVEHMRAIAERENIPHQMEILPRGGTDGGAIQRTRAGTVSMTLSVPTRYIHTVNEMAHEDDVDATITLLTRYIEEAHKGDYAL